MAELETQADSSRLDPIARLHRMSTTAGVGTQEYVAISTLAVVAALLGVATALSFLGPPFMFLGLAGLVAGSWRFSVSAGATALRGDAASPGWGSCSRSCSWGWPWPIRGGEFAAQRAGRAAHRCRDRTVLRDAVVADDYDKAYALFAPEFQQAVPLVTFRQRWDSYKRYYEKVLDIQPNGIYRFAKSGEGQIAETQLLIKVQKRVAEQDRHGTRLVSGPVEETGRLSSSSSSLRVNCRANRQSENRRLSQGTACPQAPGDGFRCLNSLPSDNPMKWAASMALSRASVYADSDGGTRGAPEVRLDMRPDLHGTNFANARESHERSRP